MPDTIDKATSGRSKCRGCSRAIGKGELRFGESLPNPYAEGETLHWFHLVCAACMRPERFAPALAACSVAVDDRRWLERAAEEGMRHRRLPRLAGAERAKSGRARCRTCRETIEKDAYRLSLIWFEEGRPSPAGYVHAECALAYFGTTDVVDRVRHLVPDFHDADAAALGEALKHQRAPKTEDADGPSVAKTEGAPGAERSMKRTADE